LGTVSVTTKEGNVIGWTYSKETKSLVLPNFLAGGTVVTIDYKKVSGTGKNNPVEFAKSPATVATKLTPEIIKFLDQANPVLEGNCTPCHASGGNNTRYVGSFENVSRAADEIKRRIALPDADAAKMPRGKTMSADNIAKLKTYLDTLGQ
jgi:hypothetical protein